jgi:hypothetical protein
MSTPSALPIRLVATVLAAVPRAAPATAAQPRYRRPWRASRSRPQRDITKRVNALDEAITTVNDAKGIGSGRATLDTYLGAEMSPLSQLNKKIQGDRTVEEAVRDFSTIFSAYDVYLLVLPAARIAADAGRVTPTAIPALTKDSTEAQAHDGRQTRSSSSRSSTISTARSPPPRTRPRTWPPTCSRSHRRGRHWPPRLRSSRPVGFDLDDGLTPDRRSGQPVTTRHRNPIPGAGWLTPMGSG